MGDQCEFQEVCVTTNFWVVEKAEYIKTVCKTDDCINCTIRMDFKAQGLLKGSEEWKKIVNFIKNRKRQFPPHGLMKVS